MIADTLLCYKICYCLGAANATLQYDYPVLNEIADEIKYFEDMPSTRLFRAINHVFFYVCRYKGQFAAGKPFRKTVGNRLDEVLEGTEFTPDVIFSDSGDLLDFLGRLAEMSRKLLPVVYDELKPGITFTSFEVLVGLPTPSKEMFDSATYNMRNLPAGYNFYFFNKEALNVSIKSMFTSDSALLKAVRIARGAPRDAVVDTSRLAEEWKARGDSAAEKRFTTVAQAAESGKSIIYIPEGIEQATQTRVLEKFTSTSLGMQMVATQEDFEKIASSGDFKEDNVILVCRRSKSVVDALLKKYPKLQICIVMTMEQQLYKSILAGYYDNVTVFSTR